MLTREFWSESECRPVAVVWRAGRAVQLTVPVLCYTCKYQSQSTDLDTHGHTQGTSGCSNESPCHPVPCCIIVIYFWVWETLLPVAGPGRSRQLGVSVCTNIRMGAASYYEMYIETETSLYWTQVAWFKHFKTLLNRKYIRSLCICLHVYNRRYLHES